MEGSSELESFESLALSPSPGPRLNNLIGGMEGLGLRRATLKSLRWVPVLIEIGSMGGCTGGGGVGGGCVFIVIGGTT